MFRATLLVIACSLLGLASCGSSESVGDSAASPSEASEYGPSMRELLDLLRSEGDHETYPPASEADLAQTERVIGTALPPSYRAFASAFSNGAYVFQIQEISATGAGNDQVGAMARMADDETEVDSPSGPVPANSLVPFSYDSNGNYWCFLTSRRVEDGEYPVAYFDAEGSRLAVELPSFKAWLAVLIDEQEEVIRTLEGGRYVDELNLG